MAWENSLSSNGLKVNAAKTKVLVCGRGNVVEQKYETAKWLCSVCGKGVGSNSIFCQGCKKWVHSRCSKVKGNLAKAKNFMYECCVTGLMNQSTPHRQPLIVNGKNIDYVDSFCYLGDVIDSCGGVDSAIVARIRCG